MRLLRLGMRVALAGLVLFALTFAGVMAAERHAFRDLTFYRYADLDAVIVLGGGMDPDGHMNYLGRDRVAAAAWMLEHGRTRNVIMSGGSFAGPLFAEAVLMQAYGHTMGIPGERIAIEARSRTTLENLRFSLALAASRGWTRIGIVTNAFHLHRALMLARLLGRDDVKGFSAEPFPTRFHFFARLGLLVRETLAWWYNLGKAGAWTGLGALGWSGAERGEVIL